MKQSSPYLIPFYIPQYGCVEKCIYCNSHITTHGEFKNITEEFFKKRIEEFIATREGRGTHVELAFYGGSFNSIDEKKVDAYLALVKPYLKCGKVDALRVSLRPDCLGSRFLEKMIEHRIKFVELGVQSLNDDVLKNLNRGHDSSDVKSLIGQLKKHGIKISAHLMVGLPGENENRFLDSLKRLISFNPDFMRIHPTLVLKNTVLERMYRNDRYSPLELSSAVSICSKAYSMLLATNIQVLRFGLQANDLLSSQEGVIAGPYHPSFGELVVSKYMLEKIRKMIDDKNLAHLKEITIKTNSRQISKVAGLGKINIQSLKQIYGFEKIIIMPDESVGLHELLLS